VPTRLVAQPTDESATQAARAGELPILVFDQGGKTEAEVDARFAQLGALLSSLRTRKLIFLHRPGGLRAQGAPTEIVNLTTEYDELRASRELSRKEVAILVHSRRLVFERVQHKLLVAVTSPLNLFRELFTVKGAGTLLRRGAVIARRQGLDDVDRERLSALLASAFGRPPVPEFFSRPVSRIYLEEAYRGAAIVVENELGAYLTKFAVDREAQGEGMGRDLWQLLAAEYGTIYWRARVRNPVCAWYDKLCGGMARFADWNVYWKGLPTERIPRAIEFALAQPVDIPSSVIE
jgi:acetylglutamate kinase